MYGKLTVVRASCQPTATAVFTAQLAVSCWQTFRTQSLTVITGAPNSLAIWRSDLPSPFSGSASSRRNTRAGLPQCLPRRFASRTPGLTRSQIKPSGQTHNPFYHSGACTEQFAVYYSLAAGAYFSRTKKR